MKHREIVLLALLLPAVYACKAKKNVVQSPVIVEARGNDNEIDNIKKDFPGTVERTASGIRFTFSSEILFSTNSSYLNDKSKGQIDDVAKVIQNKYGNSKILVEGHTDKTGTANYNVWLSEKRAASVKTYLVSQGLSAGNIKTEGLGDSRPVSDNKTKEGRYANRRVEVTVLKAN